MGAMLTLSFCFAKAEHEHVRVATREHGTHHPVRSTGFNRNLQLRSASIPAKAGTTNTESPKAMQSYPYRDMKRRRALANPDSFSTSTGS